MKAAFAAAAILVAVVGCSGNSTAEGQAAQECTPQVRLNGVVYNGAGYTDRDATRFATAEEADCDDVGPSPQGSVFSEDSGRVTVWSFTGYAPDEVLGVRFDEDSLSVFVADSVVRREVDRIVEDLSQPEG